MEYRLFCDRAVLSSGPSAVKLAKVLGNILFLIISGKSVNKAHQYRLGTTAKDCSLKKQRSLMSEEKYK